MSITIYDIAKAAGVSIATVSRVFNNTGRVREKTRNKVLRIADEMGYHPQIFAQSLAKKKNNTIMLFIPVLSNYFFMEILSAIQDKLTKYEFELNIVNIIPGKDALRQVEYHLKRKSADGYLFISLHFSQKQWKALERFNMPISLIDDYYDGFDSVCVDNKLGAYTATSYFLDNGNTRVAMLSANPAAIPVSQRLNGYKSALEEKKIPYDPDLVQTGKYMDRDGFTELSGYQGMKKILELDPLPEACFCISDIKAVGALKAMREANVNLPIISYDNLTISEYIGLSTIYQPLYEMGLWASEKLISRIDKPDRKPVSKIYEPELILRSSSEAASLAKIVNLHE